MNIGIAGPVSLRMLSKTVIGGEELPVGYQFPLTALWVEELMSRGHAVTLFTLAPEISEPRYFDGQNLRIFVGRYRKQQRARDFFRQEREDLRKAMVDSDCDVIHAHWTYEFALAALASNKPTLITAHDAPFRVLRFTPDSYRVIRLMMALTVARRARHMTAVSDHIASHFRTYLRYRGAFEVIPNFLASSIFDHCVNTDASRRYGVTFACALVGWGKLKNSITLFRAFARLRRQMPKSELLMFGNDFEQDGIAHRWACAHDLQNGIQFIGRVPHEVLLRRLAQDVDVLVHPSLEEALSVTVMEAMAVGLPIIAGSATPGMSYLLEDGKCGALADVRSDVALSIAMARLAEDPSECHRLGRAARLSAFDRFRVEAVLPAFERAYAQVAKAQKSGTHSRDTRGHMSATA